MLNTYNTAKMNVAKLMLDFVLTDEGQTAFAKFGARPIRWVLGDLKLARRRQDQLAARQPSMPRSMSIAGLVEGRPSEGSVGTWREEVSPEADHVRHRTVAQLPSTAAVPPRTLTARLTGLVRADWSLALPLIVGGRGDADHPDARHGDGRASRPRTAPSRSSTGPKPSRAPVGPTCHLRTRSMPGRMTVATIALVVRHAAVLARLAA